MFEILEKEFFDYDEDQKNQELDLIINDFKDFDY